MPTLEQFDEFTPPTRPFPLCATQCALLAEVNHRTANQFAILTSYIRLSIEEFRKQPGAILDLQLAFAAVEARARALASLNLQLMTPRSTNQPVDLSIALHDICSAFNGSGGTRHSVVDAISQPYLVSPSVNMAVAQIVTEALMNALKYAYPEGQAGDIRVRSMPAESGALLVEVVDRGVEDCQLRFRRPQKASACA